MIALPFYLFSLVVLLSAIMVVTARNPVHSVFFLILSFFGAAGLFVLNGAEFLAMALIVVYVGAVAVLFLFVVMMLDIPVPTAKAWFLPKTSLLIAALGPLLTYLVVFAAVFSVLGYVMLYLTTTTSYHPENILFAARNVSVFTYEYITQGRYIYPLSVLAALVVFSLISTYIAQKIARHSFINLLKRMHIHLPLGWLLIAGLLVELYAGVYTWKESPYGAEMTLAPMPPAAVMTNTHALGQIIYTDYMYVFQASGLVLLVAMIGAIVLTQRKRQNVKKQDVSQQIQRTPQNALEVKKVRVGEGI
jgi:NADH:ubiquinone oxidoreductase subunit 6 (subunit J)